MEVHRSSLEWVLCALVLMGLAAGTAAGQTVGLGGTEEGDLAALVVTRDVAAGGHRARLATHEMQSSDRARRARVSAALFLPEGERAARDGLIAFLVDDARPAGRGGEIRFGWRFAGLDTAVVFPVRVHTARGAVSYAAELTEQDLRFLAAADGLDVTLPDGTVLFVDAAVRRRLGLLARLSALSGAQRDELAAFSRAIEGSIRSSAGR